MSAVETYDQAMQKFEDQAMLADLRQIRVEHDHAVGLLRAKVLESGGSLPESSEPWGAFAAAVTGADKLAGPATALTALLQGEEHGINEYEDALKNPDVDPVCKDVIRRDLLPRCRRHVDELNRLVGGMK